MVVLVHLATVLNILQLVPFVKVIVLVFVSLAKVVLLFCVSCIYGAWACACSTLVQNRQLRFSEVLLCCLASQKFGPEQYSAAHNADGKPLQFGQTAKKTTNAHRFYKGNNKFGQPHKFYKGNHN